MGDLQVVGEVAMDAEAMIEVMIGVDTLLEAEVTVEAIEADQEVILRIRSLQGLLGNHVLLLRHSWIVKRGSHPSKIEGVEALGAQGIASIVLTRKTLLGKEHSEDIRDQVIAIQDTTRCSGKALGSCSKVFCCWRACTDWAVTSSKRRKETGVPRALQYDMQSNRPISSTAFPKFSLDSLHCWVVLGSNYLWKRRLSETELKGPRTLFDTTAGLSVVRTAFSLPVQSFRLVSDSTE